MVMYTAVVQVKVCAVRARASHLAADVNRDADDHGGDGDACDERDADRSSDQSPQLPQDLLLPAPRLLTPKCAARRTDGGEKKKKKKRRVTFPDLKKWTACRRDRGGGIRHLR